MGGNVMQGNGERGTRVPEIRFGGFSGEWEEKILGNVTESFSGGTPQVGIEEYYKGEIPFIRSAEINSSFTELFISEIGFKNSSAKMVNIGCILYALYGATSGEVGLSRINGAINQAILAILPNKETSAEFIMQWLRKNKSQIINTYLQGGQGNLSGTIVKGLIVNLPNTQEQTKIGNFFQQIDRLISQHQQKHDKLLNIKKALLEKMFPQPGKTEPEIRFKGFSGEWEEKELREIGNLKNGMNFDKNAMGHGYPFVNLQDVFGKNVVSDKNLGLAQSTEKQRKEYSLQEGDVLFIRSSVKPEGVGETAVISRNLENTTYSGFIIRFRPSIEMSVDFNRFLYSIPNIRKQILASANSSANTNINQESLQRLQLVLPTQKEQTKIGNFFQQLDRLISQHQTQIQKLNHLKQAFLSKMFV